MRGAASIHPPQLHSKLSERGGRLAGPGPRALFHRRGGNSRRKLLQSTRNLRSASGTRTRITARTLSAERGLTSRERLHSKLSRTRGEAGWPRPPRCSAVRGGMLSGELFLYFKLSCRPQLQVLSRPLRLTRGRKLLHTRSGRLGSGLHLSKVIERLQHCRKVLHR